MPRRCSICDHRERTSIENALIGSKPLRTIAKQNAVSVPALLRHKGRHLPATLLQARSASELTRADALIAELQDLHRRAGGILSQAEGDGDLRTALAAIRELRGNLELLAKLAGELREGTTVNVLLAPEYLRLRGLIMEALAPYPDARTAVAAALRNPANDHA